MKKICETVLICIYAVLLTAISVFVGLYVCEPKGQSRDEINIAPPENAYIDDVSRDISGCTPLESLFILAANVKNLDSYYAVISGEVKAAIVTQTVSGEKYKVGEEALYVSRSVSTMKNTADKIFISGSTVLIRSGDPNTDVYEDAATKYSLNAYLEKYGTDFRELSNYELNEASILSAELVSAANGIYTFRYEINVSKGVDAYRVNMTEMGALDGMPTFTKSTLEVAITADFKPIYVKHTDEYSVKMFLTIPCKSTIVERFEKINDGSVFIPEYDFFKARLDG